MQRRTGHDLLERSERSLFLLFDRALDFAAGLTRLDGLAAVVLLLPLRQCQLHLCVAPLRKINAQRHESQTFKLSLSHELVDFLSVQQELAFAKRIMVGKVAMRVGTDMAMLQIEFVAIE